MDWTLEDDMVDGLFFCATLTSRRGGHTLHLFDETSAQPRFAVVNCSDAVMSVFYSYVLTFCLIFLQLLTAVS